MTAIYCDTSSVKRILQKNVNFSGTTRPTDVEVIATIEDIQDEIDHQTQHAWREKTVTDEFYDIPVEYNRNYYYLDPGIPIHLRHRQIKTPGTAKGDKIEVWDGGTAYTDYVASKTEGRNNDYWLDEEKGVVFFKIFIPFYREKAIRMTYRYGGSVVPNDIRRATAMMAAVELIQNDDRSHMLNDLGQSQLGYDPRIAQMQKKIDKILKNHTEIIVV